MEKKYRVQYDFNAEAGGELSCRAGEIASSTESPADGWLKVRVSRRGKSGANETAEGLVPVSFLVEMREPSAPPLMTAGSHRPAPTPPGASAAGIVQPQNVAVEHAECPICYDEMASRPIAILLTSESLRSCRHFLHHDCASSLVANRRLNCPVCRASFARVALLPDFDGNPMQWFNCVDADGNRSLSKQEVIEVFKGTLPIDYRALERNVDSLWPRWDKDKSGEIDFQELCDPKTGLLVYVRTHFARVKGAAPPVLNPKNLELWFTFWDEDGNGTLDREEILRAMVKTFKLSTNHNRIAEVREVLNMVWDVFDTDKSGVVELDEFTARDGLGETLCASLQFSS